jgi:F-type H+-transporting ATPase subunit delta
MHCDVNEFAAVLFAAGRAADCLTQIENELATILPLIVDNEQVREFLSDPTVQTEGKRRAIEQLVGGHALPPLLFFLCFLADARQLTRLKEIAEVFFERASRMRKQASGELVSAVPLNRETLIRIEQETGNLLGKKVSLRPRVDPEILGGLYVRVGDFVIDGTVDRQLDTLRQTLTQ